MEFKDPDPALFKIPTDRPLEITDKSTRVHAVSDAPRDARKGSAIKYAKLFTTVLLSATCLALLIFLTLWWGNKKRSQ